MVDSATAGPDGPAAGAEYQAAALVRALAPLTGPDQDARERMRSRILTGLAEPDATGTTGASGAAPTRTSGAGPARPVSRRGARSRAPRGRTGATRPGGD
ncbi:hypothetical protein, partial [Actinophytocola sp.]|uniref:hypothetical protein n=1 Tax=Actinophytocola sp. TaxID=1872138 RepID=UPI002D7FC7A1